VTPEEKLLCVSEIGGAIGWLESAADIEERYSSNPRLVSRHRHYVDLLKKTAERIVK